MNNLPTPLNRVELYLATAAQMPGVTPPEEPLSRLEQYLAFIAGDTSIELPAPASLCEQWLAYVAGITPAEPLKLEGAFHVGVQKVDVRFFAVAAGMPGVVAPEPQNRTEQYWSRLAEILPVHGVLKNATGTNITLTDVAWWKMGLERINGDTTQNPAPSPDSPQAINTVTGLQTVTVRSPQLLTKQGMATPKGDSFWNLLQRLSNSDLGNGWARFTVTTDNNYGNFWLSTTAVEGFAASSIYTMIFEIDNITNKTGYIDFVSGNEEDPFASFVMVYGTSSSETVARLDLASNQTLFVIKATTKASVNKALRAFTRPNVPIGTKFDIRATFLAGDHTADWQDFCGNNWEPYQNTEYKLNLVGSNLYDKNKAYKSGNDAHLDIDVEPNTTYVFSTGRAWTGVLLYDSTDTQTRKVGNDYGLRYDVIFTTRPDEVKATLTFYLGAGDIHTYDFTGVDFHESIELRKIGTYQDYIYKNGKDWYVHNNTSIQAPNATSYNLWTTHPDACMYYKNGTLADALFQENIVTAVVENLVVQPQVKNMTTYYNTYGQTNKYGFVLKTDTPGIMVQNKDKSDVSQFTSWIQANPLVIRYVLATPTDAKITNQTLISQLNALDRAILPQPVTYITASGDLPGELKISYYGEEE